jgi:hypothetical protein
MSAQTKIQLASQLETPIVLMSCPQDLADLATAERQQEARRIYEAPGIIILDNAVGEATLEGLREGLTSERRKFKDKFNRGLPTSETFKRAHKDVSRRISEMTRKLFGYDLPEECARSYRPMITEDEPLHYDTYDVECGKFSLMAVVNFDTRARVWNVGPTFREICRDSGPDIEEILKNKRAGESASVPIRSAGLRGHGPLRPGIPLHHIEFAPGSVWYANPKTISHQITYGGGAYFEQWNIQTSECRCQSCIFEHSGLRIPNLRTSGSTAAA